jgi:serine/threonine protein phosphatase PrpC
MTVGPTLGRHVGLTDTGRKRRHNEDSYVVRPPLFAVADGMGGAQAGEVASRLAVEALDDDDGSGGGVARVEALVQEANRRVYRHAEEHSATSGMGTTMTLALVEDGTVTIGHVGDSRAYLIRDGSLEQLTEDHSLVAELIRSGKLSPEEADSHPQRSVITRALGTDPDVDVDTYTVDARPGDVFLLCSDGLTSMVGTDVILAAIEEHHGDFDAAAKALVVAANRGGGEDNITVVCFEIAAEGPGGDAATGVLPGAAGAAGEAAGDADDEDTLDELDQVPAVRTQVLSAEEVQAAIAGAAAPRPDEEEEPDDPEEPDGSERDAAVEAPDAAAAAPRRRSRQDEIARRVLATLAVLVVLAAIVLLALWGLLR